MGRYLGGRALQAAGTLLLATFVFHTALSLLPGDPIRALFGPARPDPGVVDALRAQYHFDDPWLTRYWLYLGDLLQGDWGYSFPGAARDRVEFGPPVADVLRAAVPVSTRLLAAALVLQTVVGVVAGVVSRRTEGRLLGGVLYGAAVVLVATPVIVVAFALRSGLGYGLGWLPTTGVSAGWSAYVLPAVAVAAAATGYVVLLTRSELRAVSVARYIAAAQARAIPDRRIVGVHALRASLVAIVTVVSANTAQLLTALVIVEGVFEIPGVGGTLFTAVQRRDHALLIALLVFSTAVVLAANLVADLLYAVIDPRIRTTGDPPPR